jgi:hypothetical protein
MGMSTGKEPLRPLGKLYARARVRRRRARADVERDSALPVNLFDCQEPMVEAALVEAAGRLFLDKLGQPTTLALPRQPPPPLAETVDAAALDACLAEFRALGDAAAPDPLAGLADERLWVLLDLARHGSGVGRQRATLELRASLRELSEDASDRAELLRDVAQALQQAVAGADCPVVFTALLLEARTGLRRLRGEVLGQ